MGTVPQPDFPTSKALVLHLVESMPDAASLEDIGEQSSILAAIERAERASAEGKLVTHDEVKARLATWLSN
jgi:predicted transcriptional regulator